MTEKRKKWLVSAGLLCLVLLTFGRILGHDFADLDDFGGIQNNPQLEVSSPAEALHNAFTQPFLSNWIPLTALSHQLDRRLYGDWAGGHLGTNLVLHAASSVLLFLALCSLTQALGPSAFVAAVFAVHPLHVETVAWIAERKGVLSGLFFVLTLLAYASYARRPTRLGYAGVFAGLVLALLAKPTAVTLPCVLLLLDHWPLRRLGRRALLEKLPMLVPVVLASLATFVVQRDTGAMHAGESISLATRVANALAAYGTYLVKSLWPTDLAAFYPYPAGGPGGAAVALGAVALLLGTALCAQQYRRRGYLCVGWLWFAGMLVPMIGLVQVGEQSHADRYMYLPLIGLAIAVAWAAAEWDRSARARRALAVSGAAAVACFALASGQQLEHWRDGWALWRRVLQVEPDTPRAHVGLGSMHARLLEFEDAERHYLAALEIAPEDPFSRSVLRLFFLKKGAHLAAKGDPGGSLHAYSAAVEHFPDDPTTHGALATELARQKRWEEAIPHLERALELQPGNVEVLLAMAVAAHASGRYDDAVHYRREVARLAPARRSNLNNLAWLLATAPDDAVRDPDTAVELAERMLAGVEQPSANHLDTLAASYAAAGRFEEAIAVAERAARLAEQGGSASLARVLQERATLYREGRAFVETPPG